MDAVAEPDSSTILSCFTCYPTILLLRHSLPATFHRLKSRATEHCHASPLYAAILFTYIDAVAESDSSTILSCFTCYPTILLLRHSLPATFHRLKSRATE